MITQYTTSMPSAMKMPIESPWSSATPQKTGSFAPSAMSLEIGIDGCAPCSGPPWPKRYEPTQTAIQLSMIVEITSWAPTVAFNRPAMPAHAAPASAPITSTSRTCRNGLRLANEEPSQTAKIVPARYWPCPPMLNIPQRNANATARAVRMIGVVVSSVCCKFCAAVDAVSHGNHTLCVENGIRAEWLPTWKNQFRPVPLKTAL